MKDIKVFVYKFCKRNCHYIKKKKKKKKKKKARHDFYMEKKKNQNFELSTLKVIILSDLHQKENIL